MLPKVHEVKLANGFRALLVERHSLPIVSSMMWYRVGSRDERTGETGLSHFLEHMMFKGTEKYAKGEIDQLTSIMGGSNNAFTDSDVTAYYFSMASDRWHTALEIEASRMRGCLLDEKEFLAEKNVVLEELAMGEDDPWHSLYLATDSLVYQVHPYHHPIIGWRQDVEDVSVDTMRAYYQRNYGPDRAFMVVMGDMDVGRTEAKIRKLFAGIKPTGEERPLVLTEPRPRGERRCVIRAPGEITRMAIAFQTCRMGSEEDFVCDVMTAVLGAGRSSRLHKRLVQDMQILTDVSVNNESRMDPGVFWISCELRQGVRPEQVETVIREELERLKTESVSAAELRRARTQLQTSFLFEEETTLDAAMKIGRFEAQSAAGYKQLADIPGVFATVDSRRIREVARRYLHADAWNVVWSLPQNNGLTTKVKKKKKAGGRKKVAKKPVLKAGKKAVLKVAKKVAKKPAKKPAKKVSKTKVGKNGS